MKRWSAVALLAVLFAASAACISRSGGSGADATISPNLTPNEVYARMERALDGGGGKVLHVSLSTTDLSSQAWAAFDRGSFGGELWISADKNVARVERKARILGNPKDYVLRSIVREDGTFLVDATGIISSYASSQTCRGSDSVLLAQLMQCPNYPEKSTTTVAPAERDGRAAIVLVTTGTLPSEDSDSSFENRLYLDPTSYLPIGLDRVRHCGGTPRSQL